MIQYDLAQPTNTFKNSNDKNYELFKLSQSDKRMNSEYIKLLLRSEPSPDLNNVEHTTRNEEDNTLAAANNINNNTDVTNDRVTSINTEIHGQKHKSDLTHGSPSNRHAPLSPGSFKASPTEMSDSTNNTTPSSIDETRTRLSDDKAETSTAKSRRSMEPVIIEHVFTGDVDPLHVIDDSSASHRRNGTKHTTTNTSKIQGKVLNKIIKEESMPLNGGRRHTSPNPEREDKADLSYSHSLENIPTHPITRSTFPYYNKKKASSSERFDNKVMYDSTSSEITRMKNSLLVQRNLKKKKTILEDEKVLVGNKISEGHENFVMAYNMLTGIRVAVSRCSGIMKNLDEQDFKTTKKLSFNMDGGELTPSSKYDFKFKDYCPEVFRELRTLFGIDPADYLISVTGKYILSELGSPGKSGSFFYYSRDYRFIIKTIHHGEHKQLRRILKEYYHHVKQNPNTLISQFYGLHRVKMPFNKTGIKKVHFLVMNNLFPPHRNIHLKYDLKGSTSGRKFQIPVNQMKDLSNFTLKDLNWLERNDKIKFGPEKRKVFFQQLEKDVSLLKKINVMDYSLLLGIHDVKMGNNTDNIQRLSIFDPKSTDKHELITTNPRDIDVANDLPNNLYPGRLKYIFYGHDGGIRATNENNEPLAEIYYLGIIDCLTNYSIKKRLETLWRSLGHSRRTISAVPAKEYGDRFLNFIKDGTANIKTKIK